MSNDMEFTMGSGGVPVGAYQAEFIRAERFENDDKKKLEEYGPGVALVWRVIGGQHDGAEASRVCSMKMSPKSALGKMTVALNGGKIEAGQKVKLSDYVGVKGSISVEETESGGTRVAAFIRSTPSGNGSVEV